MAMFDWHHLIGYTLKKREIVNIDRRQLTTKPACVRRSDRGWDISQGGLGCERCRTERELRITSTALAVWFHILLYRSNEYAKHRFGLKLQRTSH